MAKAQVVKKAETVEAVEGEAKMETPATQESAPQVPPEVMAKITEQNFKRLCAITGLDYNDILAKEERKKNAVMIELDLHKQMAWINGKQFGPGKVVVDEDVANELRFMLDAKKNRLLNEKIGRDMEVIQTQTGFSSRVLKTHSLEDLENA